jgi:hypothetical protein
LQIIKNKKYGSGKIPGVRTSSSTDVQTSQTEMAQTQSTPAAQQDYESGDNGKSDTESSTTFTSIVPKESVVVANDTSSVEDSQKTYDISKSSRFLVKKARLHCIRGTAKNCTGSNATSTDYAPTTVSEIVSSTTVTNEAYESPKSEEVRNTGSEDSKLSDGNKTTSDGHQASNYAASSNATLLVRKNNCTRSSLWKPVEVENIPSHGCKRYASISPGARVNGITITSLWKPTTFRNHQIRYFVQPGMCQKGACWRCLQSPQSSSKDASRIASCSSTGKFNIAERLGDTITWRIVPSKRGPDGEQMYNLLSVNGTESSKFRVVYENVVFGRAKVDIHGTNYLLDRFRNLDSILKPVVIFQPCTGRILMNDAQHQRAPIQLLDKKLSDLNSAAWALWSIRRPSEIDESNNKASIHV